MVGGLAGGIATLVVGYTYDPGDLSLGEGLQPVPGSNREYYVEYSLGSRLTLSSGDFAIEELAAASTAFLRARFLVVRPQSC